MAQRKKGKRPSATSSSRTALRREAEEAAAHIRALWRELFRNPFAEAEAHGLTGPQVNLMACLVSRGPMTLTALSRALGMSHSTASGIVDRLQLRGLVGRTEDKDDRRRTAIAVTGKVSQYVRELEFGPTGRVASALTKATASERRAISVGLATLRALVEGRIDQQRVLPRSRDQRRGVFKAG